MHSPFLCRVRGLLKVLLRGSKNELKRQGLCDQDEVPASRWEESCSASAPDPRLAALTGVPKPPLRFSRHVLGAHLSLPLSLEVFHNLLGSTLRFDSQIPELGV